MVRTVETEIVRSEFYKTYPALDGTPEQRQSAKRTAFGRAVNDAQARNMLAIHASGSEPPVMWLK
jgi:hypothetical protein